MAQNREDKLVSNNLKGIKEDPLTPVQKKKRNIQSGWREKSDYHADILPAVGNGQAERGEHNAKERGRTQLEENMTQRTETNST